MHGFFHTLRSPLPKRENLFNMQQITERVRLLNDKPENKKAKYVLYWMQMFKRTSHNHALKFAIEQANERDLPLVVYEGLKFYYPWASDQTSHIYSRRR